MTNNEQFKALVDKYNISIRDLQLMVLAYDKYDLIPEITIRSWLVDPDSVRFRKMPAHRIRLFANLLEGK